MIDLFNIPNSQDNTSIFYANGSAWQTWRKPRKCNYVFMMAIGGGAGGAGGLQNAAANMAVGGPAGAITRALFNSSNLPDILYIQVGLGGRGGIPNNSGAAGNRSFISLSSSTIATNVIMASGTAGAVGGPSGAGSSVLGETAFNSAVGNFITLSTFISTIGNPTPLYTSSIIDITPLTSQITCPGAGGGGVSNLSPRTVFDGSSINATSFSPRISGGTSFTGSTAATNGDNGYTSWKPFFSTGGAGGGCSYSGTSGNGGKGGIGSGGGAGGVSYTSAGGVAGNGGDGGDGLVIIVSF
jgi:hypothetical protein